MAITINQSPAVYTPAYNDIIYVVTSNNKTQTNFKYVADVVIAGVSKRLKISPHPTYGSVVFNFGRIIETYVSSDISKSTYGFQQNLNSYTSFTVQFGEEYGPSSGTTIYPNLTTGTKAYAWSSIFDFLPFQSYTATPYVLNSTTRNPHTNKPLSVNINDDEDAWLYIASNTSGTIGDARIRTYNSAGATIQTVIVNCPFNDVLASDNSRFLRFSAGTHNLNLIASSGVISGAQPIITGSVASYDIAFRNTATTVVSTTQTYLITNTCTKNVRYRFHFLNKLGGFDSFTFIRGSTKTVNISRSNYKKSVGALTSATAFSYSASDRQNTQYNTSLKDNYKVKSDWIDESTCVWLEELITSPEVYLDDPTYGLVAVNINNSSYQIKQTAQDKLFDLEIDFEFSYNRYRQRG